MRTKIAAITLAALSGCERQAPPPADNGAAAEVAAAGAESAAESGPLGPGAADQPLAIATAAAAAAANLDWGPCPAGMPAGCEIAVLHGDPARPNSDILLRVPGGAAIAPHWHSSAERMVLTGGRLEVKYQGAAAAMLEPGSYAYGPARLPHRGECRSSGPCTLFIAFEGPVDRHAYEGQL